jgi:hypothetical protein
MAIGSSPMRRERSPVAMEWDGGASKTALQTRGNESTSPTPVMPASVWTRTTRVSWVPSERAASTYGKRR